MQCFMTPAFWPFGVAASLLAVAISGETAQSPDYDEPPRIVKQTKPNYPQKPFARGIEGTVEILFVVDEKGRVTDPRVIRSIPELDRAALDCVKQWKFRPAKKGGRAVRTEALAPVTFRITRDKK